MTSFAPDTAPLYGSLLALGASLFWTLAPFLFAGAVRRIGAKRVNPLRLGAATVLLVLVSAALALLDAQSFRGIDRTVFAWFAVSGFVGLAIGDACYLTALGYLGPRRTLQVLVLVPVFSAAIAWLWLGERIAFLGIIGLVVTLAALFLATALERSSRQASPEPGALSWRGLLIALAGAFFQGAAAVLARKAFILCPQMHPVHATTIRIASAALCIWVWVLLRGQTRAVIAGLADRDAMRRLGFAVLLGPVLGMLCYVGALRSTPAGVVSLLSSLSPVLIIPITAWRYRMPLQYPALLCMIIAVAGVLMVMLR